jgi:hypothetical protein
MAGFDIDKRLASPAVALLCLGVLACGSTGTGTGSGSQTTANATTGGGAPAASSSNTAPVKHHLIGDYDNDDYVGKHYGDADIDENENATDRDNDYDNSSGSYYDQDDNGVRYAGHAASAAQARAVASVVRRFYQVAAAEDGAAGCSTLMSRDAHTIAEDLGRSASHHELRGNTCPVVMSKLFKQNHQQLSAYAARLRVTGVRLEGERGIAVLGFGSLPGREIEVVREGGAWKINVLLDSELP